ncbi:hypothetical protein K239x_42060 [Planctomycetes bacterium K23_9]|uniref:Uncharacterized protein n=1 Tax=Stieleria marina TaxID=1930275 RepID=A0A517NYK1_9BACT|nr:hypothetical protein K239x_42060 [Planctomycetes bacterium K23_9]
MSDYFGGNQKDSLADLLRDDRDADAGQRNAQPQSPRRSDNVGELADDEPTYNLLDDDSEFEEEDEQDELLKAAQNRTRALAGHLNRLQKPLGEIRLVNLESASTVKPVNQAKQLTQHLPAQWVTASGASPRLANRYPVGFCHRPLYFQELDLERCGEHFGCLQNLHSAAHFLIGTAIVPYRMATQCPDHLVRGRGDCRTGHTIGHRIEPLSRGNLQGRGVVAEAAAIAGFTFLLL